MGRRGCECGREDMRFGVDGLGKSRMGRCGRVVWVRHGESVNRLFGPCWRGLLIPFVNLGQRRVTLMCGIPM